MLTQQELEEIREFATRGEKADGTQYPGGSINAMQKLLRHIDSLEKSSLDVIRELT